MARTTVYNKITSDEKISKINKENIELMEDWLEYLRSIDRAKGTISSYKSDMEIFFCWNLEFNKNKFFVDLTKREISKFQSHAINEWKWSPKRTRRVKSTLSSISNFIESILDDDYEGYRPIIRKIENPADVSVREKTVFSDEKLQELLDALVENKQYMKSCLLALAMFGGRRKAELPRFKVSYFDEENIIYGSLYKTPEKVTTKGRGSRGKLLDLYTLKNPFKPYLDLWLEERNKLGIESIWLFPKKVDNEYINEQIEISTLDSWADTFSRIIKEDFYWHSLRHYFTTTLSKSGLPDSVIQEIVGWNTLDMVSLYCDTTTDETLSKYFDEGGIKKVKQKTLSDL